MADESTFAKYEISQTYSENYNRAPEPDLRPLPDFPKQADGAGWTFCGKSIGSPLGMPAGPLLNGNWVLYYAALGFDVLTYKTVRTQQRACYPLPNLLPISEDSLQEETHPVLASAEMQGSWAISFGMPSAQPEVWREDVSRTREHLPAEKLLVVSVVGSVTESGNLNDLADDYALAAGWAIEAGADAVELNLSCPNVSTCDGQLFQNPEDAGRVAERVREEIGEATLLVKIGRVTKREHATRLLEKVGPLVNAFAMTNCLVRQVQNTEGDFYFNGEKRGIGGRAVLTESISQVKMFSDLIQKTELNVNCIGVGGIASATDVRAYLDAGAEAVQIATAAMQNPNIAREIREEFAK